MPPPASPIDEYPPYTPIYDVHAAERVSFIPGPALSSGHTGPAPETQSQIWLSSLSPKPRLRRWNEGFWAWYNKNTGLLLVLLAQLFGSGMNICVKLLNGYEPPVHPLELVVVRMVFTFASAVAIMYYTKVPHPWRGPPGVRLLLVVRGVTGFFGLFGMYFSLQYLSLSDAIVLTFLTPTACGIVSHYVLGESFSAKEAVAGLISLFGVMLIARPSFLFGEHSSIPPPSDGVDGSVVGAIGMIRTATAAQRLAAVCVSLLGVCGGAGAITSLRAIGTRAHFLHSVSFFSLYSIVVASAGMALFRIPIVLPREWTWVLLFLIIGVCGFFTQVMLTMGLQRETAGRAMLTSYSQVVIAAVFERVIFDVYPTPLSMCGIGVILTCAFYVAVSKTQRQGADKGAVGLGADVQVDVDVDVESGERRRTKAHGEGDDFEGEEGSALSLEEVTSPISGEK